MMKHTTESTKEYLGLKGKRKTTPKPLKDFSHADIKKTLDYIGVTREEKLLIRRKRIMKAKILYLITTAVLIVSAFLIGKSTTNWADIYCNSNLTITDWNTDGHELSMVLSDGREIYAYK